MTTPKERTPAATPPFRVVRSYVRLPPERGGMENHIASLSEAQRCLGLDVVNVFNAGEPTTRAVRIFGGVDLSRIRPAVVRNALFYGAALRRHSELASDIPTILHVHGDLSDFAFSKLLAPRIGAAAAAATIHSRVRSSAPALYRWALAHCGPIFATGKYDQLFLENALQRPVIHLPSAPADLFFDCCRAPAAPVYDVIGVSSFTPVKGVDLIIECAAQRPNKRFVVFGDGPERARLTAAVHRRSITNISFPGAIPPSALGAELPKARIFLSTSHAEGTPTAALEAMAAGLPIVLTPSNDYRWLIENGERGCITTSWSVEEILASLDSLLENEPKRRQIGESNRGFARRFSWAGNARTVTQAMSAVLNPPWEPPCAA